MILTIFLRYRRAIYGVGILLAVLLGWRIWLWRHDVAVIKAHEAEVAAQVQAEAIDAAERATEAVSETKGRIDETNEQARRDASGSDDPLRSGLDSLRTGSRPSGQTAH